ncbi:HIT domain-containing protein [Geminicoccaceae bacterium 1502E]|nr:HIT domain-containing protein [Geminicoccaceae bacterium 1502E]
MAEAFILDPRLGGSSALVADWPLCELRLKDDARFAWLLLVPRRAGAVEFTDLSPEDYRQLCEEILAATRVVEQVMEPDKVNVAMLGNVVSQMHVHVVGRFRSDPAWPGAIWCAGDGSVMPPERLEELVELHARAAEAFFRG